MRVDSIKLNNSYYKPNMVGRLTSFRSNASNENGSSDQNQDVTQFREKISPALGTDLAQIGPIKTTFNKMVSTLKRFFQPEFNYDSWYDADIDSIIYRELTN